MNQKLLLVILAVALIPAFFAFGRGITGMVVSDNAVAQQVAISAPIAPVAQQTHPFLSGVVLLYVLITIVVLAIATSYLITLYGTKPAKITPHKHLSNSLQNIKFAFKSKSIKSSDAKVVKKIQFAKISDERASQFIVGIVGLVGLVAILIMIL